MIARAKQELEFEVVAERKNFTKENLNDLLRSGSHEDILQFVATKNLFNRQVFSFPKIYWLLPNEQFYRGLVGVLRERGVYEQTVWMFALHH